MISPIEFDEKALMQAFTCECEEGLASVEQLLVVLESTPNDISAQQEIFRVIHTLKGNAGSFGFTELAELAHVGEDVLDRLRNGDLVPDKGVINALLFSVDVLRQMASAAVSGDGVCHPDFGQAVSQLKAIAGKASVTNEPATLGAAGKQDSNRGTAQQGQSIRVPLEKLDRIMNLAAESTIAQGRLRRAIEEQGSSSGQLDLQLETESLLLELQENVMRLRMVPIGPVFRQFSRVIRDLAVENGKLATLTVEGEDVELDTTVIDLIRDPLTHMIRNSLDHGIEKPEAREAAGKDRCGQLKLTAFHDGGEIVIELRDDGAGLNRSRILARAIENGLVRESQRLSDAEICELIFEPGFSTAAEVSRLSGRGVGMDVVRRNIQSLNGNVSVSSVEGAGTTITLRLPLTLSILEGFSVVIGEETFIIPLEYVTECVELPGEQTSSLLNLRGQALPFVRLRESLQVTGTRPARESIVIVRAGSQLAGFVVDGLLGTTQAVIKPLAKVFQNIRGVSGSTILSSGRVALILDVPGLLREISKEKLQTIFS